MGQRTAPVRTGRFFALSKAAITSCGSHPKSADEHINEQMGHNHEHSLRTVPSLFLGTHRLEILVYSVGEYLQ